MRKKGIRVWVAVDRGVVLPASTRKTRCEVEAFREFADDKTIRRATLIVDPPKPRIRALRSKP